MSPIRFLVFGSFVITNFFAIGQTKSFAPVQLQKNVIPADMLNPMPNIVQWVNDDNYVINKASRMANPVFALVNVKSGLETTITSQQLNAYDIVPALSVRSMKNDLYLFQNGVETKITNSKEEEEKNPTFSPDSNYIAFTRSNNLFTYNLRTKKETQLTTDGNTTTLNGYASWVYYEEIFGRPTAYRAFWWSPNSKVLSYMHFDESQVPMFPIYNSEGQHGFLEQTRYPEAGDKNPDVRIGFVNPDGGTTTWADFDERFDQYFGWPIWKADASTMLVQWINRDQNDLKIYEVKPQSGEKKLFYEEQQKTWVDLEDGAGERITYLANGQGFILKSDKSGWNHLYFHNMDGTLRNAITIGNFTVKAISFMDEKNNTIYFTARKENSTRTDLYSIKMTGKDLKRLTFGNYNHNIDMSPNGKYFITTYSNVTTPPQISLVDNKGNVIRQIANSKGADFNNYKLAKTELLRIKSDDGLYDLPAMVTWPANYDSTKKYPLLISIYGGPNAGTVMDMFNWSPNRQWYAQEGLIQVAFDHRASGHFGKEGVNYMFHNLGFWEMKDYKTMTKYFIKNYGADSTKICMTGFSYGGYMTCYALTYGSDVFTHGMAGGSVTDWHLYDSHYTEKFMGTPTNNPDGYKTSSVLEYVNKYKGKLQIVHGTMDDNVHMQNSIQLISKLEDIKKDFEFKLYPGGRHGWRNLPAKNEDFENLKTKFIYKYLLEKTVPDALVK